MRESVKRKAPNKKEFSIKKLKIPLFFYNIERLVPRNNVYTIIFRFMWSVLLFIHPLFYSLNTSRFGKSGEKCIL